MNEKEPISDEEIHGIDEEYGYILGYIKNASIQQLEEKKIEYLEKYSNYIYENDKEFTKQILLEFFYKNQTEDIEFILREPNIVSPLNCKWSIALKFKRHEKDKI